MGRLAKVREQQVRKQRVRQLWEALVDYANADEAEQLQWLKKLISGCMNWTGLVGGNPETFKPETFKFSPRRILTMVYDPNLEFDEQDFALCKDVREGASLGSLAARYKPPVSQVLSWLITQNAELADASLDFLKRHGTHIQWDFEANKKFDPADKHGSRLLCFETATDYGSIMSPVCRFVLDEIDRYNKGEGNLSDIIPLGICEWKNCGKFMIVRKAGKRFCCGNCRASNKQAQMTKKQLAERRLKHTQTLKEMQRKPIAISKPKRGHQ